MSTQQVQQVFASSGGFRGKQYPPFEVGQKVFQGRRRLSSTHIKIQVGRGRGGKVDTLRTFEFEMLVIDPGSGF